MQEGIFAALDQIETITGEKQVTAIGYCVGGTLTAATLAYMAAKGDDRIDSATLFTTQVDFTDPGDLKVFADEDRIKNIEDEMHLAGYLEGRSMANAFNMLRPNDLIWSYVVNNYLKGIEPMAFDLLTWNTDSTRMPRANHSYYLRNCYLENRFAKRRWCWATRCSTSARSRSRSTILPPGKTISRRPARCSTAPNCSAARCAT